MKKRLFFLLIFFLIMLNGAEASEMTPSFTFKYHLHNLFESYSKLRKSADLKQYDEMGKHLTYMAKSVGEIRDSVPKKNIYGTAFDRKKFIDAIDKLDNAVQERIAASGRGELNEAKLFTDPVIDVCIGCHTRLKLHYLFDLTYERTTFSVYMHELSEQVSFANANIRSGKHPDKVVENIRILNYSLGLLQDDTFPEKGPSGIISDKEAFNQRLRETKAIGEEVLKKGREIKMEDLADFKKSLNGICINCHEPDLLK